MREAGSVIMKCNDCGEEWDHDYDPPQCVCEEPEWDSWTVWFAKGTIHE